MSEASNGGKNLERVSADPGTGVERPALEVYRDGVGVTHLPSNDPRMVKCGLDTEWMEKREFPAGAAHWCLRCERAE